jgi:hypothetical protein
LAGKSSVDTGIVFRNDDDLSLLQLAQIRGVVADH